MVTVAAASASVVVIYLVIRRKTALSYLQITYNFHTNHSEEIAEVWRCMVRMYNSDNFTLDCVYCVRVCVGAACVVLTSREQQSCETFYLF